MLALADGVMRFFKRFEWSVGRRVLAVSAALALLEALGPAQATPDRHLEMAQAAGSGDFARLKPLADKGDAASQYRVGLLYAEGRGVERNLFEAARYYRLAADQGHPEAQSRLAMLNCNGVGVPKSIPECLRLYRLAADAGVTPAQVNLAARYLMGDGTDPNHGEAARLAKLAAGKGDANGQMLLAMCYELGAGVPKNRDEALRLYGLAAAQGNASAQKALARLSGTAPTGSQQRAVSVSTLAVALRRQDGILMVPAVLNEAVSANFVVDSGASLVAIPQNLVQSLRNAGKIAESDFTGHAMVQIADGSTVRVRTFVLRSFAIRDRVLQDIGAAVVPGNAPPLLGQSFLQRFSSWSIDNERQLLLLREKSQ